MKRRKEAAEQLGRDGMELEMMRNEIGQLENVLSGIGETRDKQAVEIQADLDNKDPARQRRLAELEAVYSKRRTELRAKREELKRLADKLQTSDTETLSLRQQLAMKEYYEARAEMNRAKTELRTAELRLEAQKAASKALDEGAPPAPDIEKPASDAEKTPGD